LTRRPPAGVRGEDPPRDAPHLLIALRVFLRGSWYLPILAPRRKRGTARAPLGLEPHRAGFSAWAGCSQTQRGRAKLRRIAAWKSDIPFVATTLPAVEQQHRRNARTRRTTAAARDAGRSAAMDDAPRCAASSPAAAGSQLERPRFGRADSRPSAIQNTWVRRERGRFGCGLRHCHRCAGPSRAVEFAAASPRNRTSARSPSPRPPAIRSATTCGAPEPARAEDPDRTSGDHS